MGAVLVGVVVLSGCAAPLLPPEDRAAICSIGPVSNACITGRARWPQSGEIHQLQLQLTEQKAVAAEKKRLADEQAERERQRIALAADQAQEEETEARRKKANAPRYTHRRSEKFSSYRDAVEVLNPENGPDAYTMARGPAAAFLRTKGHIIAMSAQVMQVAGQDGFLANPCFPLRGAEDMGVPSVCPVFVRLAPGCGGDRDLTDDMNLSVIVEVEGTMQYQTAVGTTKTVPKLVAYGITGN
jgi:hypothetical protein